MFARKESGTRTILGIAATYSAANTTSPFTFPESTNPR
jgi:hypothetical protein